MLAGSGGYVVRVKSTADGLESVTVGTVMTPTVFGTLAHAAALKTPPVDADEFQVNDSAASFIQVRITWANIKAALKTYFDTLYQAAGSYIGSTYFSPITNSLSADVSLANPTLYYDGPTVVQGASGAWFASGTVSLYHNVATAFFVKLWDGTTVIASTTVQITANSSVSASLSGFITSPAGNLRISVKDITPSGTMLFNNTTLGKDCTITAFRIG